MMGSWPGGFCTAEACATRRAAMRPATAGRRRERAGDMSRLRRSCTPSGRPPTAKSELEPGSALVNPQLILDAQDAVHLRQRVGERALDFVVHAPGQRDVAALDH